MDTDATSVASQRSVGMYGVQRDWMGGRPMKSLGIFVGLSIKIGPCFWESVRGSVGAVVVVVMVDYKQHIHWEEGRNDS